MCVISPTRMISRILVIFDPVSFPGQLEAHQLHRTGVPGGIMFLNQRFTSGCGHRLTPIV